MYSPYSLVLFRRVGFDPLTPGVAGIAEDYGDIVIWFTNGAEIRYEGMAL